MSVRVSSPAKVNLALEVRGRRREGYHEIRTVYQALDLQDVVAVERRAAGGIEISCDHPGVPANEANLAARAHALLRERHGVSPHYRIRIEKQIPPGSGLGGGSSNAAATLAAVDYLEGLGLPAEEQERLGGEIGSDVPFFVRGGTRLGSGRGEVLETCPALTVGAFLLALPEIEMPTARVYATGGFTLTPVPDPLTILSLEMTREDPEGVARGLFNALEGPAFSLHPALERLKGQLLGTGALGALLSGSGSCVFGYLAGDEAARQARDRAMSAGTPPPLGRVRLQVARPLEMGVRRLD